MGKLQERAIQTLRRVNSDLEGAASIMSINRDALEPFLDDVTLDHLKGQITMLALASDMLANRIQFLIARDDKE